MAENGKRLAKAGNRLNRAERADRVRGASQTGGAARSVPLARPWIAGFALLAFTSALVATTLVASRPPQSRPSGLAFKIRPADEATASGFHHFYNMRYGEAIADFDRALSSHPEDPYAVNHLLEAVLFGELHHEGKLNAQLYVGNEFVHSIAPPIDPRVRSRISGLIKQASELEDNHLAKQPNDTTILYARSVTQGLRATDEALIEKSWFTALRSGLGAYDDSKKVLELDPSNSDAKLIVGIYNYVTGSLPWPVKVAALLATVHGSKAKGLEFISQSAEGGGEASIDARTVLGLFLAREHRYRKALDLLHGLYAEFPYNFLFGLSEADLLKDSGRLPQAAQAYRRLLELGQQGMFPTGHLEMAALELGNTLRLQGDWRGAAEAYESAAGFAGVDPQLQARARLAAGQMYDLLGQRSLAVENYQRVIDGTNEELSRQARDWLLHPYRGR